LPPRFLRLLMEIWESNLENDGKKIIVNNWIDGNADILCRVCKTVASASSCPYP